jgi:hypothetical protein
VDAQCPTALPSFQNASATRLFWSYKTCNGSDADAAAANPATAPAAAATVAAEGEVCKW